MTYKSTYRLINFVSCKRLGFQVARLEDLVTNEVASMMQHLSLEKFCPYSEDAKKWGAVREVFEECDYRVQRGACMSFFDDRSICMARSFSCIHDGAWHGTAWISRVTIGAYPHDTMQHPYSNASYWTHHITGKEAIHTCFTGDRCQANVLKNMWCITGPPVSNCQNVGTQLSIFWISAIASLAPALGQKCGHVWTRDVDGWVRLFL